MLNLHCSIREIFNGWQLHYGQAPGALLAFMYYQVSEEPGSAGRNTVAIRSNRWSDLGRYGCARKLIRWILCFCSHVILNTDSSKIGHDTKHYLYHPNSALQSSILPSIIHVQHERSLSFAYSYPCFSVVEVFSVNYVHTTSTTQFRLSSAYACDSTTM